MMMRRKFVDVVIQPALLRLKSSSRSRTKGAGVDGLDTWQVHPDDFDHFAMYADEILLKTGMGGEYM